MSYTSAKTITWLLLSRLQRNKPHRNSPEPSEPCLRNLHQHAPELSGTPRNLPELASGTYTIRSLPELPELTPFYTETLRNLPELVSGTNTNTPEPSGTFRNLPEPSGTFRTLPPEPTPSGTLRNLPPHTGTLRNLPEPSSGTSSCEPHRRTPELIWAEDPISLRCWGKKRNPSRNKKESLHFELLAHLLQLQG